jgi:predicted phosphodiesterase
VRFLGTLAFVLTVGTILPRPALAEPFKKGPYLQMVTKESVWVMWETEQSTQGKVTVKSPTSPDIVVAESAPARMHEVEITGLKAGSRYRYEVDPGNGGEKQVGELTTAPNSGDPFSFVVFGDTRSNTGAHRQVVERVRAEVPDFILATGDMVNEGTLEAEWQTFFEVERDLLRDNPFFPAIGNHDREPRPARTAENYRKYFHVPADTKDPERYYAFTYGNARFVVLDSNLYSFALTDQTAWMEREFTAALKNADIRHIFVVMHHPPFSTSIHGGHSELREMWTPLFEKYGVRAVFSGHDHTYERAINNNVRYLVSGGGGAPLYPKDPQASAVDKAATRYFERTFQFLRVSVIGDFIEVAAIRADGSLMESFAWGARPEVARKPPPPTPVADSVPEEVIASTAGAQPRGCQIGSSGGSGGAWVLAFLLVALYRSPRSASSRS